MNWYYIAGGQQIGPVTEADFNQLVQAGTITGDTLVWREGMADWRTYREVLNLRSAAAGFAGTPSAALDLRPMNIGDILDRTFRLYRSHFMPFFLLMLVVHAASYIITVAWQSIFTQQLRGMLGSPHPDPALAFIAVLVAYPPLIVGMIFQLIGLGVLTAAVSDAFLHQEVSLSRAWQRVRPRLGTLLGVSILASLLTMLGCCLCFVPGVYFALWYALTIQVVIIENQGVSTALQRSKELMRVKTDRGFANHNYTKAGIIYLITVGLALVIVGIVAVPFGVINVMRAKSVAISPLDPLNLLQGVLAVGMQAAVAPFGRIAMILFYYDIRIRKEGFDLEVLAATLGTQQNPA